MIRIIAVVISILIIGTGSLAAGDISLEKQWEIIQAYLLVTGQADKLESLPLAAQIEETGLPIKCGTPAVLQFILNRDKFDEGLIESLGELVDRPFGLSQTVYSPSNRFLIHYTTQGTDAIPNTPGYADSVAAIFDEVYFKLVDTLGYPDPPEDDLYPAAGDEACDVYLLDLSGVYGLTQPDMAIGGTIQATAFVELDNDYDEFPLYRNQPLDAVRVTAAHEFFHVIQLGIDYTEYAESPDGGLRSYWMEMSATWSEEVNYDDINDYYLYLPIFFHVPYASLQRFDNDFDLHPYASMLYPQFLSERFSPDLIRDIWLRCAALGAGEDQFLLAADDVIDDYTNGAESFASSFREFTLWNYFTGSRADLAPDGLGYEERANYSEFMDHGVDSVIALYRNYENPIDVEGASNNYSPQHNAAFYLQLEQIQTILPDTTYWICHDVSGQFCNDSTQVTDTTLGYDFLHVDSSFSVGFDLDADFPRSWGLNIVYLLEDYPDSSETEQLTLPADYSSFIEFFYQDYSRFRSMVFTLTPASNDPSLYIPSVPYDAGYEVSTEQMVVESDQINLPAAVLSPYPNPAVVSALDRGVVTFRFQVPTDSDGIPLYGERYSGASPSLYVDIYSVAGELVCTLGEITDASGEFTGIYETDWDLKNAQGKNVASGVYVAYARLFGDSDHRQILAEEKTKVLIIR